jgi:hypothetical protein
MRYLRQAGGGFRGIKLEVKAVATSLRLPARSTGESAELEQLGAELAQAVPLHSADKGSARSIERFDHRALPTRFRDDAHDARAVAQQRTDRWTQSVPPDPRSFLFHIRIYIDVQ